ncbi:hypothetical protein BU24DRAFT_462196 [Aaosphaeria arxii CBS 175.79]|uniref:Nucleolar protein 12 n=1 Tax=Aaosphaeria arxii CBS 175.79 TaxID=1450172 RepID=A0A6A5XSR1_9PLEO|nr:uncharacterized protein BU24DRAFT_462196 [Aaosphaeria arxii CBS 175.79]KAF2015983.1 hypothetical protein BU24DRAFT_462196 [Aaosphaeria arxii CBS 175.79]
MPPPSKKRKFAREPAPEEITFDYAAREEYLTGFHKRKQARIKHAQEEAAKKEKEEKLKFRRELRQQRKEQREEHVEQVNAQLRGAIGDVDDDADGNDSDEEFAGFEDVAPEPINREDEYIDEDKYTTVTIESVGISKDGFEKVGDDESSDEQEVVQVNEKDTEASSGGKKKKPWAKENPNADRPKKKKKKFRYESKAERKVRICTESLDFRLPPEMFAKLLLAKTVSNSSATSHELYLMKNGEHHQPFLHPKVHKLTIQTHR